MIPAISGVIGPLGAGEWSVGSVGALTDPSATGSATAGTSGVSTGGGGFGSALSNAIDSLEQTQNSATTASMQLATGQLTDPTKAVTAVENASLSMDLASQIQSKLVSGVNTIFQTQV